MAKSIRSKAKMAARKKKRESGNYHAADAARVARLSAKLTGKKGKSKDEEGDDVMEEEPEAGAGGDDAGEEEDPTQKKVSTSAPRGSRRDNWRNSKGVQGKRGKVSATGLGGGKRPFKPNRRR